LAELILSGALASGQGPEAGPAESLAEKEIDRALAAQEILGGLINGQLAGLCKPQAASPAPLAPASGAGRHVSFAATGQALATETPQSRNAPPCGRRRQARV
jgi:hypothetical protein